MVFDANVTIGNHMTERVDRTSPEEVMKVMDEHGIQSALCVHTMSLGNSIRTGEELLARLTSPYRERLEIRVVHHPLMESADQLLDRMGRTQSRCVQILVGALNLVLRRELFGGLFVRCRERRIPVWIDDDQVDWQVFPEVLAEYPTVSFIVGNAPYARANVLGAMMKEYRNLYAEVSRFNVWDGYRGLSDAGTVKQLVFGSALPKYSPAAPLHFIRNAGLSGDDQAAILGGTMVGLLEGSAAY
jgi:hypothetical protein